MRRFKHCQYSFWCDRADVFDCDGDVWLIQYTCAIHKVHHYQEVANIFTQCRQGCLALFDLDDTLIQPKNPVFQTPIYQQPSLVRVRQDYKKRHGNAWFDAFQSTVVLGQPVRLVEPDIRHILATLRAQGALVLGLTDMPTGSYGRIASMANWRLHQLASVGIHFDAGVYQGHRLWLGPVRRHVQPWFQGGVLMTQHWPKGLVLERFLSQYSQKKAIKKLVFVDDLRCNIESMRRLCLRAKLPCQLVLYRHAKVATRTMNTRLAVQRLQRMMHRSIVPFA